MSFEFNEVEPPDGTRLTEREGRKFYILWNFLLSTAYKKMVETGHTVGINWDVFNIHRKVEYILWITYYRE